MSNRIDATNCTHEAALARVAELESKLANAERDFQESYASAGKWQGLAVEYKSKLERASKFANANAEDVESLQGKVRELESLCSSQALRLQEALDARNERSAQFVAACQENLMLSSRLDSGRRIAQHWADQHSACAIEILSTLVEIQPLMCACGEPNTPGKIHGTHRCFSV